MAIDSSTVRRIAHLARLKLPESEEGKIMADMNRILELVNKLDEVDVTGIEPLSNVNDALLHPREDIVNDGGITEDILANAPAKTADFFTVPKVVE